MASIGAWSAAGAFAAAVGPSLGGVLVYVFGWRSLFVINVPTGLALGLLAQAIPDGRTEKKNLPDPVGTGLLAIGVGLTALGLSQGHTWGWASARTAAALTAGLLSATVALIRSRTVAVPAIQTELWKQRTFAYANATSVLYGLSLCAWMLLGVLVLTNLWGYSELNAGLAMTPGALAASAAAIAAGRARGRAAPRNVALAGALLMGGSGLLIATTLPRHPHFLAYWLPLGLVLGAGMGLVTTGTSTAAALSLPPSSFAAGTGLNQTARQIGGAIGIATLSTLIAARHSHSPATFEHVYIFVALAALAAGIAATGLTLPRSNATAPAGTNDPSETNPRSEADDQYIWRPANPETLPWRRVVSLGDSIAEGIGDPTPGYFDRGWTDRIGALLAGDYLNLGKQFLLASEIRQQQLDQALAFTPDLAIVAAGGNDLLRHELTLDAIKHELDVLIGPLRGAGADVLVIAPFDITRTDLMPGDQRAAWHTLIEHMRELAIYAAHRHGAILVDFHDHPAGGEPSIYSTDLIHLSARGHAIAAAEALRRLSQVAAQRTARNAA